MRLFRPGLLARGLYPDALFRVKTTEKVLFLTFDDGPDPLSTPQLLHILNKYKVKALFFCNGNAAEKNRDLMSQLLKNGHSIGNHGYSHFNGWRTSALKYADDVIKAASFTSDKFFRPPFGRITPEQMKLLKSYKLIFWDLMAYDFDQSFGPMNVLNTLKRKIRPGSVIILHDTSESYANAIIEEFLEYATGKGYRFGVIESKS
jgi:peptidoglycan/xylan/chitin deacetylase (PgdA/CDA1 family)